MARGGARREQRHAVGPRRWRRVLSWAPEFLVVVLVVISISNARYDLGHRWLGLERADPDTSPAEVLPPLGLDLHPGTAGDPVAAPASGSQLDADAVRAALAGNLGDPRLGKHVAVAVGPLVGDDVVFTHGSGAVTPASTTKLLTSLAALEALGPMTRFSTRVVASGNKIVLVGGGDPYLATSKESARGLYPARADVGTLAQRTAAALRAQGLSQVQLSYDASLFTGPAVDPQWPANYLPDNVVPPISALWVDQGKVDGRYVPDPAGAAGRAFAAALGRAGIKVIGAVGPAQAPVGAKQVAIVRSAPLGEMVQHTLTVSDNNAAEVIAHQVGLEVLGKGSFAGGAAGVFRVLAGLGIDVAGSRVFDGSGLSRKNLLTPELLLDVLRTAASPDHPQLREVVTGLPVAGFTGSLTNRFDTGAAAGRGRVAAKTGTLTGVHGLAGIATDLDGDVIAFVMIADRVAVPNTLTARREIDEMAAALGACHCAAS